MLDIIKIIDVWVTHDRSELTGQDMDETAKQKQYFEGNPSDPRDFYSPLFTSGRQEDLLKLVTWMKQRNLDLTFYNNVQAGTQDPWQRMKENDPNHQTTQYVFEKDQQGLVHMVPTK